MNDDDDISAQVRALVSHAIRQGCCSLEHVAERMAISPRTLQRRLAGEGHTFKSLCSDVRMNLACRLLIETRMSVGQLSVYLGYTEASAFTRAFRQNMGIPPKQWRKTNKAPGAVSISSGYGGLQDKRR